MLKKLRLGVLGLGEGRSIISAAINSELWELAQVCDINEQLCKERAAEFRLPHYTLKFSSFVISSMCCGASRRSGLSSTTSIGSCSLGFVAWRPTCWTR